jgi:hypothetical protein
LWEETGYRTVVEELAEERKHRFALEHAVFWSSYRSASPVRGRADRVADRWRDDYRIDGVAGPDLHHLYRAMTWLGEELLYHKQNGRTLGDDRGTGSTRVVLHPQYT